jgi:hypothetical protein
VLFGYWNSLVSEHQAGRVCFAGGDLSGPIRRGLLQAFAERFIAGGPR